ncbi:glutamine amidotransferase subunit pdxT [Mycolicibacterium fortuitum]|uniref:glutaminase n=1 Tax=Mycolicibacterium fortuitum TaxID=1766 RepID=A0A378UAG4_MYCFO|nr:glutamine amidotransferase subunit pdxT [Mycolicibacterium fortuitum]
MTPRVGVLALQGDTREHLAALREAGAEAGTVRRLSELDAVDALVIPGGESTAMSHLLREFELLEPLRARIAAGLPCYGSCAGMILLASEIADAGAKGRAAVPLKGIDMTVRRNAFGRQVDSFEGDIDFVGLDTRCMRCSSGLLGWSGSDPMSRCWRGRPTTSSRCARGRCWRRLSIQR